MKEKEDFLIQSMIKKNKMKKHKLVELKPITKHMKRNNILRVVEEKVLLKPSEAHPKAQRSEKVGIFHQMKSSRKYQSKANIVNLKPNKASKVNKVSKAKLVSKANKVSKVLRNSHLMRIRKDFKEINDIDNL